MWIYFYLIRTASQKHCATLFRSVYCISFCHCTIINMFILKHCDCIRHLSSFVSNSAASYHLHLSHSWISRICAMSSEPPLLPGKFRQPKPLLFVPASHTRSDLIGQDASYMLFKLHSKNFQLLSNSVYNVLFFSNYIRSMFAV